MHGEPNQQLLLHSFPFPNKTNRFRTVSLCLLSARRVNNGRPHWHAREGTERRPSCPSHSHRPPLAPPPMSRSRPLDAAGRAGGLRPNLRRAARTFGRAVGHPMSVRARAARRPVPTQSALRFFPLPVHESGCAGPRCRKRQEGLIPSRGPTKQPSGTENDGRAARVWHLITPPFYAQTRHRSDRTVATSCWCYCSMPPPVSCDSQPVAGRTRTAGSDLAACGIKEKTYGSGFRSPNLLFGMMNKLS